MCFSMYGFFPLAYYFYGWSMLWRELLFRHQCWKHYPALNYLQTFENLLTDLLCRSLWGLYSVTLGLCACPSATVVVSWISLCIKSWNRVVEAFQLCFPLWGLFWYVEVFSDQFDDFHRRALPWFWGESSEQLDEFAESEQFESSVLWMWLTCPFI